MENQINVFMGEYGVGKNDQVIASNGVGSCVVVCLYDEEAGIGGLGHVMLPSREGKEENKYAGPLIDNLIEDMEEEGVDRDNLVAKIFGGASVIKESMEIGKRIVESVREKLEEEDIDIVAEDVGGDTGRSIWLNCRSGNVVVSSTKGETENY